MKGFAPPVVRVKRSQVTRNYLILIDDFVVDSATLKSCAQSVRSWLKKCLADDPLPSGFTQQQGIEWLRRHQDGPVCKAESLSLGQEITFEEGFRRGIGRDDDFEMILAGDLESLMLLAKFLHELEVTAPDPV